MTRANQYGELRLLDLTAKLSRTKPAVVLDVLRAIGAVSEHFEMGRGEAMDTLLTQADNGPPRPANVAACEQASSDIVLRGLIHLPRARPWPDERARRRERRS